MTVPPPERMTRRHFITGAAVVVGAAALEACAGSDRASSDAAATTAAAVTTGSTAGPTSSAPSSSATTHSGASAFVRHGPRTENRVALTFHLSGDVALVDELLALLSSRSVPITAFAVGSWLSAHPAIGQRIVASGHELANHTLNHRTMGELDETEVATEIAGGGRALEPFIGSIGRWFRPSGMENPTELVLAEAARAGYATTVGYDIDSLDYTDPPARAIVENATASLQGGSIISMHFGHRHTIDALPQILDRLAGRSLEPVTLSTLIA